MRPSGALGRSTAKYHGPCPGSVSSEQAGPSCIPLPTFRQPHRWYTLPLLLTVAPPLIGSV